MICQGFFWICHLKIKSGQFLMNLKFKSGLLIFGFLWTILKIAVGFVGMWVP